MYALAKLMRKEVEKRYSKVSSTVNLLYNDPTGKKRERSGEEDLACTLATACYLSTTTTRISIPLSSSDLDATRSSTESSLSLRIGRWIRLRIDQPSLDVSAMRFRQANAINDQRFRFRPTCHVSGREDGGNAPCQCEKRLFNTLIRFRGRFQKPHSELISQPSSIFKRD
jgi:hypothetical protein